MNTKYGTLVQLSSGWCHSCDSTINGPTWCFVSGTTITEARHLVESGNLSNDELAALIAKAEATKP